MKAAGPEVGVDLVECYRRAAAEFGARVEAVGAHQWHAPTPCTEWDVRALVNHVVADDLWVAPLLAGKTLEEVGDAFDGDVLGDDPVGVWRGATSGAIAAVSEPGVLDRTVHVSWGVITAVEYLSQLFADHLIHAWDLARAVNADEGLDPELVDACSTLWQPREEELKGSDMFGERLDPPPGADRQTTLLAVFGRRAS